jgi:hypothetical protein
MQVELFHLRNSIIPQNSISKPKVHALLNDEVFILV